MPLRLTRILAASKPLAMYRLRQNALGASSRLAFSSVLASSYWRYTFKAGSSTHWAQISACTVVCPQ